MTGTEDDGRGVTGAEDDAPGAEAEGRVLPGTDPILLVGPQRSGTTALASALSEAVAAQGGCFTANGKLPYLLRRWWTDEDAAAGHLRSDEVTHALTRIAPYGTGADKWLGRVHTALLNSTRRAAQGLAAPSVTQEIRRVCAEVYGPGPWGDKYNEYLLELPWLHATFPGARWVFLVRDPADTIASMLAWRRNKPWNPEDATAASAKWAHWTSQWLTFRDTVPARRRVELDYAALCAGRADALSELVGTDMTAFLTEFRRPPAQRDTSQLSPKAQEVRSELVRLGILGDNHGR
ncbi:sulfotransferase [Streptomyces canus]|uniref:sulfotransferase family protein n=1 Tax=Streptomyces canus TaxID=58343 RepID=UPI0032535C33